MATGEWGGILDQRVFRVNILWTQALQKCQTGFHLRDVGVNTLTPEDVVDLVKPFASEQFVKLIHASGSLVGIDVVNLVTKEGASFSYQGVNGLSGGEAAPSFVTVPVSLKGGLRRRYANGRMLWPVGGEGNMQGDQLAPNGVAVAQALVDDLTSRFMGGALFSTARLVHLHGPLAARENRPAVPASWYDVSSIRVNTLLSSLRRRKVGVGS